MFLLPPGPFNFEVWTNFKPLVGMFAKNSCSLENPRLMDMREKIME